MQIDRAIQYLNRSLISSRDRELSELELLVLEGIWHDRSYGDLSASSSYEASTIRNAASKLFQEIAKATEETISKKNCKAAIVRLINRDLATIDLADAPTDIQPFCGRITEIETLTNWIEIDRCKLIAAIGIGGIGKTAIAAKLGDSLADKFDFTIWRSLREAPPLSQLITELVKFLSRFTEIELPDRVDRQISTLLDYLRQHRCLLILDNVESIMDVGKYAGNYRTNYRDYGELFQSLGTTNHQSCVVITSREMPPEIIELAAPTSPIRALLLDGLDRAALDLLDRMGLQGSAEQIDTIIANCQGNPLYLRIIANTISYNFKGNIADFIASDRYSYSKITNIIRAQVDRLSIAEKLIIYYLATHREPIAISVLDTYLAPVRYNLSISQTLVSLSQRSLIQITREGRYTLQNVVMEFITDEAIAEITSELTGDRDAFFFENLALYPATVPTYIREIQQRLILAPVVNAVGSERIAEFASSYLQTKHYSAYGVSNLINLLLYCQLDLNEYDLCDRHIRAVDFQNLNLQNINFSGVTFDRCRFSQGMGTLLGIIFSPDGQLIAAGDTNFQIKIWSIADNKEIALLRGHQGWVWDVQFSPDSQYLVSGSSDRQLRIWDARSGQCLQTIEAHTDWVWRVGFWLNSKLAISLGADRQISIWWWQTRTKFLSVTIPDTELRDGVFHGGRGLVATCAYDSINLWHIWTIRKLRTLQMPPTIRIKKATFSHDGQILIGLSTNCMVYGWDVESGELCLTLAGHPTQVNEIRTLETGEIITTCLEQVRVWNGETGDCLQVINFAGGGTICVAYHFDRSRRLLATGSDNGAISIWNLTTGKCTYSTSGNAPRTIALAANLSNAIVATGKDDGLLHLWNFARLESPLPPPAIAIPAHLGTVSLLAFSPNGKLVASSGSDRSVKVWDATTGTQLHEFGGYNDYLADIQFADDRYLLTRSYNSPLRQWDLATGEGQIVPCSIDRWILGFTTSPDFQWLALGFNSPSLTLWERSTGETQTHSIAGNRLRLLRYSADGRQLVGITDDGTLNLWDLTQNYRHRAWQISPQEVRAIAFHPTQPDLAIVGGDTGEIALWDLQTQACVARNAIHQQPVLAIGTLLAASTGRAAGDDLMASCGADGSIRLWQIQARTIEPIHTIEFNKPYQGMKINNVKGLNRSQLLTLQQLGAQL